MSQENFETVYRGRQGWLHHSSYMRMSKVMLALRALRRHGVALAGRVKGFEVIERSNSLH